MSDNGPQYASSAFAKFAETYGFEHVTSSPRFPQSNGEAERAVKTIKNLLDKARDPYLAMLAYRSTALATGYSPSQLLMGRQLRSTLPSHPDTLAPEWPNIGEFRDRDKQYRERQTEEYNKRHRVTTLPELRPGENVWHRELMQPATIISAGRTPRSYIASTPRGILRRNRRAFVPRQNDNEPLDDEVPQDLPAREPEAMPEQEREPDQRRFPQGPSYRTASGRLSKPPNKLDLYIFKIFDFKGHKPNWDWILGNS